MKPTVAITAMDRRYILRSGDEALVTEFGRVQTSWSGKEYRRIRFRCNNGREFLGEYYMDGSWGGGGGRHDNDVVEELLDYPDFKVIRFYFNETILEHNNIRVVGRPVDDNATHFQVFDTHKSETDPIFESRRSKKAIMFIREYLNPTIDPQLAKLRAEHEALMAKANEMGATIKSMETRA